MAARLRARWSAAWRDITKIRVYHLGAWVELKQIRRWTKVGTQFAWKTVYLKPGQPPPSNPPPSPPPPSNTVTLSVTLDPTTASGAVTGNGTAVTGSVTATVRRGTPPYTYHWTRSTFNAPVAPTATLPSAKTTAFSQVITAAPATYTARFRCVVVDSKGNKGSEVVDLTFIAFAPPPPPPPGGGGNQPDPSDYNSHDGYPTP